MRILIAEDDHHLQSIVETILSVHGFEVFCVSTGTDALVQLLRPNSFSLALVDLNLPGLSGEELLTKLKTTNSPKACPVAMMSATGDSDAADRLIGLGAVGFIAKPFAPLELVSFVSELAKPRKLSGVA